MMLQYVLKFISPNGSKQNNNTDTTTKIQ